MSNLDELKLFLCFLCEKYKPVAQLKHIRVKDEMLYRDICIVCLQAVQTNGLSKPEAIKREEKK